MLHDLLRTLTPKEQQQLFTQFAADQCVAVTAEEALTQAEQMTIAASPFIPSATNIQQEMSQAQDHLQDKLDKQVVVMKAQH